MKRKKEKNEKVSRSAIFFTLSSCSVLEVSLGSRLKVSTTPGTAAAPSNSRKMEVLRFQNMVLESP